VIVLAGTPVMKYWLNWRDVSGVPSTVEDLRTLLSKYSRQSLLIACSRLSVELNFGAEGKTVASDALTKKFIPVLFPPELAAKVNLAFQHDRVIFFQGQLRYIAAEATRIPCAAHDEPPAIENYELGELLLRAAEIMMLKLPRPSDPLDALASSVAEFVPVYEIDTPTDAFDQLMRIYIMLTVNIPRLASKGPLKFDVAAEFEKVFGFSLTDYINFMFALLMHAMTDRDARQANTDPPSPVGPYWLKTTTLSEETIHKVLTTISFSLADMPPLKDPHGYADFTFLRDHPYIRDGEHYFCLDYEFALGKLESGVMWRVLDSLDEKQKEPYLSFWGPVFEDYLAWLFESYASTKHNTYYPSPEYADGTQVCDAIVICGDIAILIEAKVATCRVETKYSGDYVLMKKYLESKLVGTINSRKGVTQLMRAIENIKQKPKSFLPPCLAKTNKIIPLIVTKDEIGSSFFINRYLNERFEAQFKRKDYKPLVIAPLVTMSSGSIERAMRPLAKMPFSTILEDRITADRQLGRPFEAASKYVFKGTARSLPKHIELMSDAFRNVIKGFGITEEDGSPATL
jgi:hypothetical protein